VTTLGEWLVASQRSPSPYSFDVIDLAEQAEISDRIYEELVRLVRDAYFDPHFLQEVAQRYGWTKVYEKVITPGIPERAQVKRGDFGEALANGLLEELYGYAIPVKKLRFKVSPDQTLPGTDVLALRVTGNASLEEVCFVESKLRTVRDLNAGVEGYEQLKSDFETNRQDILRFVATRLESSEQAVRNGFLEYFFSRAELPALETFRLFLWWDTSTWSEDVLQVLEENEVKLDNLTSHAARIHQLRQVTDKAFELAGLQVGVDE
jgi:hypothetical protein